MDFFEIVDQAACAVNLPLRDRDAVLREIARRAAAVPALRKVGEEEVYRRLLEREEQGSTGFGGGIAIPHARFEAAEDFVVFIFTTARGIDYQAMDRKKVQVFFVILGPEDKVREHLQILAAVSNIVTHSNIRKELLAANSGKVAHEIFLSKTREQARPEEKEKQKLLFVVLYEDAFFYDILEYFLQEGVDGATIIDSSGMGQYISNIPLFASFIGFMNEQKNHSRTIMAPVPESRVNDLVAGVERITGDLDRKQGAMVMVLDLAFCKGTMKMV